jgi:hypothetical protein
MFSDIDYSDYMSDASPSTIESIRKTLDEALYRYVSILLSQPFDVAKTVLQVKRQDGDVDTIATEVVRDGAYSRHTSRDYSEVWKMRSVRELYADSFPSILRTNILQMMILIQTNLHISPPLLHHRTHCLLQDHGVSRTLTTEDLRLLPDRQSPRINLY